MAAAAVLIAAVVVRASAQSAPPPAQGNGDAVSTMSGVFTTAQADRGEETYMGICVGCHPAGTYTGPTFVSTWGNRPLSDLYGFIKEMMPKADPGSLSPEETAQVIAYILKINRVPAGKKELPADVEPLRKIRIELPAMKQGAADN